MGETLRATDIDVAGWGKSQSSPRRRGIQPGPCLVLGIAALGVLAGCDSTSFVPSRPPELSPFPTAAAKTSGAAPSPSVPPATTTPAAAAGTKIPATPTVVRARLVELILARPASLDRSYLEQFLRRETGIKKCAFRVYPQDNQPVSPVQLAGEIRTAANRSTGGADPGASRRPRGSRGPTRGGIKGPGGCPARFAPARNLTRQALPFCDLQRVCRGRQAARRDGGR